jgi:nitric oxide reductase NorD protein
MTERSLWLDARLLAERAGRRARAAAEQLGARVHDAILVVGDDLAAASPAVAQQFYRHAAAVWRSCGAEDFARWVALGRELLRTESLSSPPEQRAAALAYFSVAPAAVAQAGIARMAAWCDLSRRVATASRKLGATFLAGTAPLLGTTDIDTLSEWARHGVRLHGAAGWRGEFLAQAYFAASPQVVPVLHANEFAAWADLGAALHPALKERQYFAGLPTGLARWKPAERAVFLATASALAGSHTGAAAAFYLQLPDALRRLRGDTRLRLLRVLQRAASATPESVAALVPVAGALVHDIPAAHRLAALTLAAAVAEAFPAGAVPALRSLPAAYEQAAHGAVERWVERGLNVAAENTDAGRAYFALESRTSLQVLHAASTAATLSDVQGVLRKYVQMLSGQPVTVRAADAFELRPPLEEFPLEHEIALPLRIGRFATHEDNWRLYRFVAAHLAGRREFGTYAVQLPPHATHGLLRFLRAPEQPPLLEDLFLVTEGFRVAAALGRGYPGLAHEQRRLCTRLVARLDPDRPPPQSEILDALLAWLLGDREATDPPAWLAPLADVTAPCVAALTRPSATADDALQAAQALAAALAPDTAHRALAADDGIRLDKAAGDALLDPYCDDDGPAPAGDAAVEARPAPPAAQPPEALQLQLDEQLADADGAAAPLSAEALQQLIEAGADLRLKQGHGDDGEGLGLYITDLLGKLPAEQLEELRRLLQDAGSQRLPPRRWLERHGDGQAFYYDEWDYQINDYRQRWCRLREVAVEDDAGEFFNRTLLDYAQLIPEVRRQFQRIRPEMYRTIKGLEDGEDFDLDAVVSARVDRRARRPPSSKLYVARTREERDVATLFLIDLSASTDEPLQKTADAAAGGAQAPQRIIDVTKEALVVMAEALEEIGDAYAIYGFSGHGRSNVEFYLVKSFQEPLSLAVKGRIGALEPKRSTRMGTALRHATEKLAAVGSRSRHIILLSDGFPQDFDYGQDRRSNVYGLRDTTAALREAESSGITPFCITVDKAGHDYLREMCDGSRYLVIEDIAALPRELPKIYQRVVGT